MAGAVRAPPPRSCSRGRDAPKMRSAGRLSERVATMSHSVPSLKAASGVTPWRHGLMTSDTFAPSAGRNPQRSSAAGMIGKNTPPERTPNQSAPSCGAVSPSSTSR